MISLQNIGFVLPKIEWERLRSWHPPADALRALVGQLSSERDAAIAESRRLTEQNDQLRHLLKQLQRAQFGQRSERLDRDQMQLALEDIETSLPERDAEEEENKNSAVDKPADQRKKRHINRAALPAHLPHVHATLEPESTVCPCCHGGIHVIGEESSQRLDKIPAQYQVMIRSNRQIMAAVPGPAHYCFVVTCVPRRHRM